MKARTIKTQTVLVLIASLLLLAAIIYQQFANTQRTHETLQQLEPNTVKYESVGSGYPTYILWGGENNLLGYAVQSEASGYGGPMTVFTSITTDGIITNVTITDNCETPAYLKRVLKAHYLDEFISKPVSAPLEPGKDIDTVSGATYTVKGIAQAVKKGATQVAIHELGIEISSESKMILGWQELVLFALYGLVFLAVSRKYSKLRPYVLAVSFLFLGIALNAALSLSNITSLISGNMPAFPERPFWYVLTLGVLGITLLWGRNFYCSWLCPFGGLQEGIYKALNFMKFNVPPQITALTQKIRWGLIWIAVMVAVIFNNPSIASYEPFAVSFGGSGNLGQWLILCLVLVTSIMIYRVWCRFICTVGAILDFIATLKRKIKLILSPTEMKALEQCSAADCEQHSSCTACTSGEQGTMRNSLEKKDKAFLGIVVFYVSLIALTLFLNIL